MKQYTLEEQKQVNELIKNREIILTYEPPRFSFIVGVVGVCTKLSLYDLVYIYRQVRNNNIKEQIKKFIQIIDEQQNIKIDIDNIELPRKYKEDENQRCIIKFKTNTKEL